MLREETESERVDCRVARDDSHAINNHRKGSDYPHLSRKYSDIDIRIQGRKGLSTKSVEDETEDEEREIDEDPSEEEDAGIREADRNREEKDEEQEREENGENDDEQRGDQENGQNMECAICHIVIDDANFGGSIANSEQNPHSTESYLLCQHCVRKFSIRSDAEQLQPRRSHASLSQGKDNDRDRVRSRRTYDSPIAMYLQPPTPQQAHSSQPRRGQWACSNFNSISRPVEETNETLDCDAEMSDAASCVVVDHDRGDPREERGRPCQQQGYCNLPTRRCDTDRYGAEIKVKSLTSVDYYSRKPIRCPRLDCSVNVAFSALTHHFLFDHPEVPILSVEPGAESTLIVSYEALSCNSSRCLALLLVSGKLSDSAARLFGGNQINPRYRNRLPLPVLAARLHGNGYACCEKMHAGGEGRCEKDVIIGWVAGLDVGDASADRLRCSIQAVDSVENGAFRSLTYTGPVTSLRTAQCPRDVLLAGDCIVLHEGLIGHITSGCTSLNVNVIVH